LFILTKTLVLAFKFFSRFPLTKLNPHGGVSFMVVSHHTIYFLLTMYFTVMVRELRFLLSNSRTTEFEVVKRSLEYPQLE